MNNNDIENQVDSLLEGVSSQKLISRINKELEKLSIDKLSKVEKYILFLNMSQAYEDINTEE
jgi:transcription termination factor NusB